MSYDYSLFVPPGPGPMSSWADVPPAPLGEPHRVRARISALFPEASFTQSGRTWFGRAGRSSTEAVEFQFTPDGDGQCRFLTVRRITRPALVSLCRALGVVAVDAQKTELIRP